jgi:hypothetical protein
VLYDVVRILSLHPERFQRLGTFVPSLLLIFLDPTGQKSDPESMGELCPTLSG